MATLKIGTYKIHPICAEVPDPTDEEYTAMAESMKARGIQKPILIWGAEVVSGKTRVRIGVEFGLKIPEIKWHPKTSGKDAVEREIRTLLMDEDYNRRHLTAGQRAIFAAPLVTTEGFVKPNRITTESSVVTQEDAAKSAGVSPDSIQQATAVLESGSAALQEAVRDGDVSVSDAAKIVDLPKSEQNAAVKAVEKGEAKTVSAAAGKGPKKPREPKAKKDAPAREPGEDPVEPRHTAPEAASTQQPNKKLDFDDKIIDQAFSKLIKAVDDRARALKQMNSAYHKTCLNRLDGFMKSFKEWKAVRR